MYSCEVGKIYYIVQFKIKHIFPFKSESGENNILFVNLSDIILIVIIEILDHFQDFCNINLNKYQIDKIRIGLK
jgi:hypothetical protein